MSHFRLKSHKIISSKVCLLFYDFLHWALCQCSWCASIQQTNAFQMENNWNSLVRLFIGWLAAAAAVVFFLRLYPYRFAVVYFDSDSMLYIVHGSRYTHIAWELHRAYFTVEEFVYLTFVIRNSIETRSQLASIPLTY